MKSPKHITIDGIRFCRDDETGYYLNGTLGIRAHRYAYEKAHGPIPDGYDVHHVDEDKANNDPSNLEALPSGDHASLHGQKNASNLEWLEWSRRNLAERARPKASEWHRSEAGREWHRQLAFETARNMKEKDYTCLHCNAPFSKKPFGSNKFCSNACKAAHRRATGIDDITKSCEVCGETYSVNKYRISRTCSPSCRNRLRAREKR
jgi:hypothetical protein